MARFNVEFGAIKATGKADADAAANAAENIAKEIFLAMTVLFQPYKNLYIHKITLWETPNCFTTCYKESIAESEASFLFF